MKKRSFLSGLSFVMSMIILLSSLSVLYIIPISAADATDVLFEATTDLPTVKDEAPSKYVTGVTGDTFTAYTAEQAAEAGVPAGYTDNVWMVTAPTADSAATHAGVVLDFTSWGIKVDDIKSMTVRYHVDANCGAIRLAYNYSATNSWILNHADAAVAHDQWAEVTLTQNFDMFGNNADGTLGKVVLSFRKGTTFYVDSITFTMAGTRFDATTDLPTVTDKSASNHVSGYECGTFTSYTAEDAAAAGLPAGYTDNVWKVTAPSTQAADNTSTGIVLDFTSWGIKTEDILSMTVRYYVDEACGAIRMAYDYTADSWIYITETDGGIKTAQWAETTLSKDFGKFGTNADGTLGKVALCFRRGQTFYVDSIKFTLKETIPVTNLFDATTDLPAVTDESAATYAGGKYGYETFDAYTAEQAAEAGLPAGYTDSVWKVTAPTAHGTSAEAGIVLDFSSWGIKVEDIQSMTIRYYVDQDCQALRLANNLSWVLNTTDIEKGQWAEYVVHSGFESFTNNADGTLGKVALCFRFGYTFYVDSITITTAEQVAGLSVPGIFSSNMVLQRDMPIEIWGNSDAEEGTTISGTFGTDNATAQVAADGSWKLTFPARTYSSEGTTLTVSDGRGNQVVLSDILIGDVWFVAGQSNAELTVSKCLNHLNEGELDIDETDAIRLFAQRQASVVADEAFWSDPQSDVIDPNWRWKRTNEAAVHNFSAIGYFFAKEVYEKTGIPQGVVMIAAGGACLSELFPEELATSLGYTRGGNVGIGGYYNALVHPFVGMNCKGMLFFQGESESGNRQLAEKYAEEMTILIEEWRELWEQDFPLYYVQLSEYPGTGVSRWNYLDILRANQFNALQTIPNSTMVVSMDHGAPVDYADWAHSPYKYQVGLRLANAALVNEYEQGQAEYMISPMPVEITLSEDQTKITVKFQNVADGLILFGKTLEESIGQKIEGFSVGSYERRTAATATITSKDTVVVDVPQGVTPSYVNYAYFVTISTDKANLYASSNLPTPCFSLPVPGAPEENNDILFEATTDLPTVTTEVASDYANGSYTYSSFTAYTAAQAAVAGLPAGYTDTVWKLTGVNNETGVVLDFTSWGIKVEDIRSMTIRFYVDADCKDVRLANNGEWKSLGNSPATEAWTTLTVNQSTCNGFANNDDGTLGKVALCFRYGTTFYVDSITFNLKSNDVEKPADAGRDEIPYETDGRKPIYDYKDYALYTSEEAAAAGVPAGYTGYVMMIGGDSAAGIGLDLTDWNIPIALVKSMTLRVYVPESILEGEVRLADLSGNWLLRYKPTAAETNKWIDITIHADSTVSGVSGKLEGAVAGFASMLGEDQLLGEVDLGFRYPNGTTGAVAYVDSITFELKEDDGKAPVIEYKGSTTVNTSAEKLFALEDLKAYDALEERYIRPVITWSEGALDQNGLLLKGTHTCVATFTDAYGNQSKITLTLNVGDKDTEAPVIRFGLTTLYATAGTRSDLEKSIVVTDNYDTIKPVLTWSAGAVDAGNRLLVGKHTLTITATDLTGLQAQKTVTVIVTNTADAPVTPTPVNG